jgi:ferrous iron transport protein B
MKQLLLVGSPNSGKSMLFNRLTGMNQRVANFPGITVETSTGPAVGRSDLMVVDFPGAYSLTPLSGEEQVAVDAFYKMLAVPVGQIEAVVCVVDATRIEKGLVFALQVREACRRAGHPVMIVTNMHDVLERHNQSVDAHGLSQRLDMPVITISAKSGVGVDQIVQCSGQGIDVPKSELKEDLIAFDSSVFRNLAESLSNEFGPKGDYLLLVHNRADQFFLSTLTGGLSFLLIMFLLFQAIFSWAAPLMEGVESLVGLAAGSVLPLLPSGMLHDFVKDALFGGLGAFLVFVPQIFILTLIVGFMEDSGYLARAAVICHRPLRAFGLTGKSFVPMLSGVACAIPGIYAARTIESPRRRWLTYFAIPLMPCSARLPVYGLLIVAFIPNESLLGGAIGLQGLAMLAIYLFGIIMALLVVSILSRVKSVQGSDLPFVLEMPPYRLPGVKALGQLAWSRSGDFVKRAGPVIFYVSLVIWVLGYFPNQGADLGESWLGAIGKFIAPVFEPIGLDWKYGLAIIASFLAREVFVGTLGTLYGIEGAAEEFSSLAQQIQGSGLSLASGVSLFVFFAIAAQCVSTLATLRRESGSWHLPVSLFVGYSVLAYSLAVLAFTLINGF